MATNTLNLDDFATLDAFDVLGKSLYAAAVAADPTAYSWVIKTQNLQRRPGLTNVLSGTRYIQVPLYSAFTVYDSDCSTSTTPQNITRTAKEIDITAHFAPIELCLDELIGYSPQEFDDLVNQITVALLNNLDKRSVAAMLAAAGGTAYGTFNTIIGAAATPLANLYKAIADASKFKSAPNDPIVAFVGTKAFGEIQDATKANTHWVGGTQTLANVAGATIVHSSNITAAGNNTTNYVYPLSAFGVGFPSNWRDAFVNVVQGDIAVPSYKMAIGLFNGCAVLNPLAIQTLLN